LALYIYIYIANERKAAVFVSVVNVPKKFPQKGERNPRLFCCAGSPARLSWSASGPHPFFVIGEISPKKTKFKIQNSKI
jgi:hypothetical protein